MSLEKESEIGGQQPIEVVHCNNLCRALIHKQIDFEDYAFNLTKSIISSPRGLWDICIDTMKPEFAQAYLHYLQVNVEAVDFMPHPAGFLFGNEDYNEIKKIKKEWRPTYIIYVSFVKSKFASGTNVV